MGSPYISAKLVSLEDVLITDQLSRRPLRAPDHEAENRLLFSALHDIALQPENALHQLPQRVMELCRAESAGISILEEIEDRFRWDAVAGALQAHLGQTIARAACPCTAAISRNSTVLLQDPERHFSVLHAVNPRAHEVLLEPWSVNGKIIGTIWAVHHRPENHFDSEDARLLHSLAELASSAWKIKSALEQAKLGNANLEPQVEERIRDLAQGNAAMKREIGQRFQAEAALRESEARLSAVFDTLPVGVGVFDNQGSLLLANREMHRYVPSGTMPSTDAARTWRWTAQHADGRQIDARDFPLACALRGQRVVPGMEMRYLDDDGAEHWTQFASVPVLNGNGQVTAEVGVVTDITALKRATMALRESDSLFRTLAEAAPAFIWRVDESGQATWVNPRTADVTGLLAEQLLGTGWHEILHPDDIEAYLLLMNRAIAAHGPFQSRIRVRVKDGSWHWYESFGAPLFAEDGRYLGHVGLSIDIDASVHAEEVLKEADRRKDIFLATLAHELRNPLAPITNAMTLLRHPEGRRRADRMVDLVERQVSHMVRLVDDLMEVSRITRGKIDLIRAPVSLSEILDNAIETSDPLIRRAAHRLTLSLPDDPITLDADKLRLTQVFANLLNNAAKFTAPGGHIWLQAQAEGDMAKISVRDDGIGISTDRLPLVFDLFAQVPTRVGNHNSGLGIGLTLVQSLVEMHGGRVEAKSPGPGQGSEFIVHLPLLKAGACMPAQQETTGAGKKSLAGQRLLVVDDNCDAADTLGLMLTDAGALVTVVYDAKQALGALEMARPQAILLDIGMEGMDGHELARRIREMDAYKDVAIIAVSGWGQAADRELSRQSGIDHHLTKPVDFDVLKALLLAQ